MSNGNFFQAAGYVIELISIDCDTITDQQTWTYRVSGQKLPNGGEISNWALQLGTCYTVEDDGGGEVGDPNDGMGMGKCLRDVSEGGCGDPTVPQQIMWDGIQDSDLPMLFTFIVSPCSGCEEVQVGIKTANECNCGTILGPRLDCLGEGCDITPSGRGLII